MKGYIYEIKNKNSGKSYIGQTIKKPQSRWNEHNCGFYKTHISNAIDKYGIDNFSYNVVEEISADNKEKLREKLNILEKYYIEKHNTFNDGYNETTGGDAYNLSKETCDKISKKNKGRKKTKKEIEKISKALCGRKLSAEHCEKISKANKGNKNALGIKHTEKARANMSKAQQGKIISEKQKKQLSEFYIDKYKFMSLEEKKLITKKANESRKKKVVCIETGLVYECVQEAQKQTGIKGIGMVCNKQRKTAGGYRWRWYEEKI